MYSIQKIHQEALSRANSFRQNQAALIEILVQVLQKKVYEHLGYRTPFDYCTIELKLSSDQACSFTGIARKSIEIPEIKDLVVEGELSISNARRIVPHIDSTNKSFWLEKATSLSQRELEKEIVKVKPAAAVREQVKPIAENLNAFSILINDEDEKLWQAAYETLIQERKAKVDRREVFAAAMKSLIEQRNPLARAKRIEKKKQAAAQKKQVVTEGRKAEGKQATLAVEKKKSAEENSVGPIVNQAPGRLWPTTRHIPAAVLRQVMLRDQGQCTHVHKGQRCGCRVFLEVHHVLPKSMGGQDSVENLTTICFAHHRFAHRSLDGLMDRWVSHPSRADGASLLR